MIASVRSGFMPIAAYRIGTLDDAGCGLNDAQSAMKLAVTIYEETFDAALRAIRALNAADHDMIELRAERLGAIDVRALRAATPKPIILTHRGARADETEIGNALEAGIDFIDVEWRAGLR